MTTAEILEAAAQRTEQLEERTIIHSLYKVTDFAPNRRDVRNEAIELLQREVDGSIYSWALNTSIEEIANTLRSIAREAA